MRWAVLLLPTAPTEQTSILALQCRLSTKYQRKEQGMTIKRMKEYLRGTIAERTLMAHVTAQHNRHQRGRMSRTAKIIFK
jgi:hypothetical protein